MAPPDEGNTSRGRRKSHHACLTCRRKKTRCPGEKPSCSSCVRLQQSCSYPPLRARNGRSEERLQSLEEKLDLLLNAGSGMSSGSANLSPQQHQHQQHQQQQQHGPQNQHQQQQHQQRHGQQRQQQHDGDIDVSERSYSATPPAPRDHDSSNSHRNQYPESSPSLLNAYGLENMQARPTRSEVIEAINLYFKYCHRQPVWLFEQDEIGAVGSLPDELLYSVLALTSRFTRSHEGRQHYAINAKTMIMLRIGLGTVDLPIIESLCLLSYSSFIDGNVHLGQFYLGLSFQLCRSAMLDIESVYAMEDPTSDRKKRLFWSLQVMEEYFGRQDGLLSIPTDILQPAYYPGGREKSPQPADFKTLPLPRDDLGTSLPSEPGIWNTSIHLGWVWSQVRKYVTDCAQGIWKEPWRHDSMYAKVLSDFMETENRIPMCHRYDSVKFYERKIDELAMNRDYWAPWLKEQFTYHAIPTVLNHPFLYIVGAQYNTNLGIPNTFWRRSSEQALLHATWIVRMIDMVVDKKVQLLDPFFGHAAAIAATVHLYYCCAAAAKLKHKSNTDFAKCRKFLKGFIPCSAACSALDRNLDRMTRIAAGSESMDVEDWMPSRIYLSVPLMWHILQFNSTTDSQEIPTAGLLDSSLTPSVQTEDSGETLEIIVATSPEITINTADGGQEAPTLSYKPPLPSSAGAGSSGGGNNSNNNGGGSSNNSSRGTVFDSPSVEQIDSLTFNTTPWLYADSSQLLNIGDMGYPASDSGNPWWEGDRFMFNQF